MKKYLTTHEVLIYIFILYLFAFITWLYTPIGYYLVLILFIIHLIFLIPYILSDKLPGASIYNPLGFIELHVNYKHHGSRRVFFILCAQTIMVAIQKNKSVCFYTWLVSADTIYKRFGDAAEVGKPSLTEKFICIGTRWSYEVIRHIKKNRNKIIKVIVHTNKLKADQIKQINKIAAN